jgi:hypothetical protein
MQFNQRHSFHFLDNLVNIRIFTLASSNLSVTTGLGCFKVSLEATSRKVEFQGPL